MKLTKKVFLLVIVVFAVFSVLLGSLAVFKFKSSVEFLNTENVSEGLSGKIAHLKVHEGTIFEFRNVQNVDATIFEVGATPSLFMRTQTTIPGAAEENTVAQSEVVGESCVALKNLNEVLVETKNIGSETTVAIDKLDKTIGRLKASVDKFKV